MANRKRISLRVIQSAADLLNQDRHTDWEIAQERGTNRNGRAYLTRAVEPDEKKERSRKSCRGKVNY